MEVVQENQFLTVLGGPGAGKSTFLKRVALAALSENKIGKLPVFLELKRLSEEGEPDLKQALANELDAFRLSDALQFPEKALEAGKLLLLLDGLDEVAERHLAAVVRQCVDLAKKYPRNRFVISCRTASYHGEFKKFKDLVLADFDEEQIRAFIDRWFSESPVAERFQELLWRKENQGAKDLARTPLLLTFLCLYYDNSQELPANRSGLYKEAIDILLKKWSAEKRLHETPVYEGLHTELEADMLGQIAYEFLLAENLFFEREAVVRKIQAYLKDTLGAPEHLDGRKVLGAIEQRQGLLVSRTASKYSFSHLTVQEYFAAHHAQKPEVWRTLVQEHLFEKRFREPLILLSGLLPDPDQLLEGIALEIDKRVAKSEKVAGLLRWADGITAQTEGDYSPAAKRALAVFLAIALALALQFGKLGGDCFGCRPFSRRVGKN